MLFVWLLTMTWLIKKYFPWMLKLWHASHQQMIAQLTDSLSEERRACAEERGRRDTLFTSALSDERDARRLSHNETIAEVKAMREEHGVLVAHLRRLNPEKPAGG